ncbi:LOW QUALITY PROTEIN: cytochrome P450 71A26-like [Carica papaya]|uniref:LOW QUALITY PROTEIN: cytochrome P450 71A26-like n=1 Tax=Carica papaya TaxID=3649 RepID=UPI000B8C8415|nr:LOW QUALITY PROTEIN: cytochrome P450 71A26-like [Carica papaya]
MSIMLNSLCFSVLSVFLFLYFFLKYYCSSEKILPPSPPKLPIIGNLHNLGLHPHRSLQALAQQCGPFMLLYFGSVPVLVISSANAAIDVMKTHDNIFSSRIKSSVFDKLVYNCKDVVLAPYGEYWRQMKSMCVVHLLSNKKVQSFQKVREEETTILLKKIQESYYYSPMNLSETFAVLANDIVCRTAFGRKCSGDQESGKKLKELLARFAELIGTFDLGDYIPWLSWVSYVNGLNARLEKVAKELDDLFEGIVEEHANRLKKKCDASDYDDVQDFVDVLLRIQKENTTGFPIDRVTIKALILDMFIAGTDTTYTTLEWTMTELLRHPKVMKKLQNEVRTTAGTKSNVLEEDLGKMKYLKAVIKEVLRLHPPLPLLIHRESIKDVNIKGYDIAEGTQVLINAWAIGRDPESWEEVEEFKPERFLDSCVDFKGHDFQLIPFGAGRRGCPGIQFATILIEMVLANILHQCDWTPLPYHGAKEQEIHLTESTGISVHRKFPLIAVPSPPCL